MVELLYKNEVYAIIGAAKNRQDPAHYPLKYIRED